VVPDMSKQKSELHKPLKKTDVFAVLPDDVRSATLKAKTNVTVWTLNHDTF
jgi:CRP-like cAMP-binding protein